MSEEFVYAAQLSELTQEGCFTVQLKGASGAHTIVMVKTDKGVHAVDNRCPHMGFPLDKGSVKDGILTCHWHHARFDLCTGGTFDLFADDVRHFPVEVRGEEVWVDLALKGDQTAYNLDRLAIGLERNLSLVVGKSILNLLEDGGDPVPAFRVGLEFGARNRRPGWERGLTTLACMMNMLPRLNPEDRPRALYHGLSEVASNTANMAPRFDMRPLPHEHGDVETLKRWFRQFIKVRDEEGAERCIVSALDSGATPEQMADMLFAAVTDFRYINVGHAADFTNKALEALDIAGWDLAKPVLTSLVRGYANAARMEESNSWRHPIDLIELLADAFDKLPFVIADQNESSHSLSEWRAALTPTLLADDPAATIEAMLDALHAGCSMVDLASVVTYAAGRRIAHFHTSNEFGDWDTALHTFTFANAIEHGLRRAPSVELLRGVFDAAMSVYLDRFLNIPSARLPEPNGLSDTDAMLDSLTSALNQQQQVREAANLVGQYLYHDGEPDKLVAKLGELLLREDREFHTMQSVEAAIRQYELLGSEEPAGIHMLIAASRYLAAHSPTVRAQGQTYQIAERLHKGDRLFEG